MDCQEIIQKLIRNYNYDKVMHLKIFIKSDDDILRSKYKQAIQNRLQDLHYIDAGFDLYLPELPTSSFSIQKIDFKIQCAAKIYYLKSDGEMTSYNTGYYLYPRSSIFKTHLRLANSTGIIDAGYRGNIQAVFDDFFYGSNIRPHEPLIQYNRYVQLCAPGLVPIVAELVDELGQTTTRGEGGFGSSGR